MKKLILLFVGLMLGQFAMAQAVVVLDLPDPCSGMGVEETISKDFDFGVYPNPADDAVMLSFSNTEAIGKVEVQVTDMKGVAVIRKQYYSSHNELRTEMELGQLAPGVYTISVKGKGVYSIKKLIIK